MDAILLRIVLLLTLSSAASAATVFRSIAPRTTDPAISTDLNAHIVAIDAEAARRGLLYVHMVGSCGTPPSSLRVLDYAARAGYLVVSLSYPNCPSVGEVAQQSTDPDRHEQIRRERLYGVDTTPLITVSRANSIENRLIRLLEWLEGQYPAEGWGAFLDGGAPRWNRIAIGGHSQGAGHAPLIAKDHLVAGVLMFGGPGDRVAVGVPAPWIFEAGATSGTRMVGFTHFLDDIRPVAFESYDAFGMNFAAPVTSVDALAPPYRGTRSLTSTAEPGQPGEYHGCVVVDPRLVILPDGAPLYGPVWETMLAVPVIAGDTNCDGRVDFADIDGFVLALASVAQYLTTYPNCSFVSADVNSDDRLNFNDIDRFVSCLVAGSCD